MKNFTLFCSLSLFTFNLVGCAHHPDVRPGAKGIHRVVVRASTKELAERSAIQQAESFCKNRNEKFPAFIQEDESKYEGNMDEKTNNLVRGASLGAGAAGMAGSAMGHSTAGAALGGAGLVGLATTSGNGYKADMKFKCE